MTTVDARGRASAIAVLSAMALVVLDAGTVHVALPTIADSLDEAPASAILIVSGYQLAILVGLLPCAHIAERFGYRRLFVAGLALFSIASILCALAPSLPMLVAARVLQGLGGAAIMSLGIALLRFALGPDRLGAAIAWNALTVALCSAAGPVLGALILSIASWPWLFLAKLPISALALAASCALPEVAPTRRSVDVPSMLLHGGAATLVFIAAQSAIARPFPAVMLAIGAVALASLLIKRDRSLPAPFLPVDLLAMRSFRVSIGASICCFAGQSAGLLALPFYLQLGLGHGPIGAGVVMSCWPLAVAVTGSLADRLAKRFDAALLCAAGGLVLASGLLLSALWPVQANIAPLAVGAVLGGLGFGLFQVPNNRTMFLTAPPERSAAAGGLQGSARLAGQTIGALVMILLFTSLSNMIAPRIGLGVGALFAIAAALMSTLEVRTTSSRHLHASARSWVGRFRKGEII